MCSRDRHIYAGLDLVLVGCGAQLRVGSDIDVAGVGRKAVARRIGGADAGAGDFERVGVELHLAAGGNAVAEAAARTCDEIGGIRAQARIDTGLRRIRSTELT